VNKIKDFFNNIAQTYEHQDNDNISKLLSFIDFKDVHNVLDLGCGQGILSAKLASLLSDANIVGLDLSERMIDIAKKNISNPHITFQVGDYYSYKPDNKFDLIICFDAYPHFIDKEGFVNKTYDLLSNNGRLIIMHDASKDMINSHHDRHAMGVSTPLKEVDEEVKHFLTKFELVKSFDEDIYFIELQKK